MTHTLTLPKIAAIAAIFGLVFTGAGTASAGTISVVNTNTASVSNEVVVTANSGGNTSRGGRGGFGANGGGAAASGDASSATGGDGGEGGAGGNGGDIQTGNAITTAEVSNDVNSTEVVIEDEGQNGDCDGDEVLDATSEVGSSHHEGEEHLSLEIGASNVDEASSSSVNESESQSSSASESASESHEAFSAEDSEASAEEVGDDSSQWSANHEQASESSDASSSSSEQQQSEGSASNEQSSSASNEQFNLDLEAGNSFVSEEEHDNQSLHYECNRSEGQEQDDISVVNANSAAVANGLAVDAASGENLSEGHEGEDGGAGGGASASGDESSASGGDGAGGGAGGDGGEVVTGLADSLASIVTVTGRTVTRISRN